MTAYRFLQPLDVLYLRGNKLFDGAGAHGEALMPPWPSVAAGAIRSRMLADAGVDFAAFARGEAITDANLAHVLGTPDKPGDFRLTLFTLARRFTTTDSDGSGPNDRPEPCFPLPADVVVSDAAGLADATYLTPRRLPVGSSGGRTLPLAPVLRSRQPAKPASGLWLNGAGWHAYLRGEALAPAHLLRNSELWGNDPRLGIALERERGTVERGMLYTAETVALRRLEGYARGSNGIGFDTGFLVGVDGADGTLPESGLLRLGGDGRGSSMALVQVGIPEPDWDQIAWDRRFRLVLTSPGLFPDGWRLPGVDGSGRWRGPDGLSARLAAAAVPRAVTVSGWDLAAWSRGRGGAKPALRAAPVGSVYWLDELEGPEAALRKLADQGLWSENVEDARDAGRRAEGFNRCQFAHWPAND